MKIWKRVTAAFLALTMLATTARDFPLSPVAQADEPAGTAASDITWEKYQQNINATTSRRLFWRYDSGPVGSIKSYNQIHVFAFAGETICFGSNVNKAASGRDIVLIDLQGKETYFDIAETIGAQGLISDPYYEYLAKTMTSKNGKTGVDPTDYTTMIKDGTAGDANKDSEGNVHNSGVTKTYTPFTYEVKETGVYTFEFRVGSGATNGPSYVGTGRIKQNKTDIERNANTTNNAWFWYNPNATTNKYVEGNLSSEQKENYPYIVQVTFNTGGYTNDSSKNYNISSISAYYKPMPSDPNNFYCRTDASGNVMTASNGREINKDALWDQTKQAEVSAWDIKVFDEYDREKTGRTYCDFMALQSSGNIIETVYVLTNDSYIYQVDFNQCAPYTFTFFSNNRGIVDSATGNILYKSVKALSNNWSNDYEGVFGVHGFTFKQPSSTDTELEKTFKIFFEKPNDDLLGHLYTTARAPEAPTNIKFYTTLPDGIDLPEGGGKSDSTPGSYVGMGGYFSFEVKEATTATLRLEFKGKLKDFVPVEISDIVTPNSTNYFYWDGRDGNGTIIPEGVYSTDDFSYSVLTKSGEIHFPILDMEQAPKGITITRISDIYDADGNNLCEDPNSIYEKTKSVVYYDESDIYYGGKIGSSATSTEENVDVWGHATYGTSTYKDTDSLGNTYYKYRNLQNSIVSSVTYYGEEYLYNAYAKDRKLRIGDHSHLSNPIDYSGTSTDTDLQNKLIDFLDSKKHPVGVSSSNGASGGYYQTTTDYAIANYWTFTPSSLSSPISDDENTVTIVNPEASDKGIFNLRSFVFYDETSDGKYDPKAGEDHALQGVTLNVYKKHTSGENESDGVYAVYDETSNALTKYSNWTEVTAAGKQNDAYDLVSTAATALTGEHVFTNLEYDTKTGTDYVLEVVRPDTNYKLTTNAIGRTNTDTYTYTDTKTNGTEIQKFTVGGSGLTPDEAKMNTLSAADVGYYFDTPDQTLVVQKTYKIDSAKDEKEPLYTFLELSYTTVDSNKDTVYGQCVISSADQYKHSYPFLPQVINPPYDSAITETVQDYYVSAEYYIVPRKETSSGKTLFRIWKHVFNYNDYSSSYINSLSTDVYYYDIKAENLDANGDGVIDYETLFGPLGDETNDGIPDLNKIPYKTAESTADSVAFTKVEDKDEIQPPFIATIDRTRGTAEITINVTNSNLGGTLEILKVDSNSVDEHGVLKSDYTPLEGATFKLFDEKAEDVKKFEEQSKGTDETKKQEAINWLTTHQIGMSTTEANGQIIFTGLSLDAGKTYTVKEIYAPDGGYTWDEQYVEVTAAEIQSSTNAYKQLVLTNFIPSEDLTFTKTINGRGWINTSEGSTTYLDSFDFSIELKSATSEAGVDIAEDSISALKETFSKTTIKVTEESGGKGTTSHDRTLTTNIPKNLFGGFNEALSKEKITFPESGTYTFEIKEKDIDTGNPLYKGTSGESNIEKSEAVYSVSVKITVDGGNYTCELGEVKRTLNGKDTTIKNGNILFTNKYTVEEFDSETKYIITKTLTGRPDGKWLPDDSFAFNIEGNDKNTIDAMLEGKITFQTLLGSSHKDGDPYPQKYTVYTNEKNKSVGIGEIDFKDISFETSEGVPTPVVYTFKISEENGGKAGIDYADTVYYLKATLKCEHLNNEISEIQYDVYKDNLEGEPIGTCHVYPKDSTEKDSHKEESHTFSFNNTYSATQTWSPTVTKQLNGRDWYEKDEFQFEIKLTNSSADGGAFISSGSVTITNATTAHKATLGTVTFKQQGYYTFSINETSTTAGIENGASKTITVYAKDNNEGGFDLTFYEGEVNASTSAKTTLPEHENFTFVNTYSESGSISFNIEKTLQGRKWASDNFTFTITPDKETFSKINQPNSPITITEPTHGGEGPDAHNDNYDYDSTTGVITLSVSGTGDAGKAFTETLSKVINFNAATEEGKPYIFTITETSGTDNIEYDTTKYEVTVTVTREISKTTNLPTGNLLVLASYVVADSSDSGTKDASITLPFTNKAYVDQSLTVIKDLQDRNWADSDTFTATVKLSVSGDTKEDNVKLLDSTSKPTTISTTLDFTSTNHEVTNTFRFYAPGTYTFTIKENEGSADGITYDANTYTWTVTVTDDGNGNLVATTNISDNKITITNTYTTEKSFDISKEFTGRINNETYAIDNHWLTGDKFTFTITADGEETEKAFENGQMFFTDLSKETDTKTVTISSETDGHKVTIPLGFTNLEFTTDKKEYTFTLKITEDSPKEKYGISYDESVHTITFTVTEDPTSKTYVITPSTETITVKNTYSAKSVSAEFSLKKELTGRPWNDDDSFTFNIVPKELTSGETVTSEVSGSGDHIGKFDLKFEKAGTYTYTISEEEGEIGGVDYDTTHNYTLTVVVKDNEKGNLIIESAEVNETALTVSAPNTNPDGSYKYTFDSSNNLYFTNAYTAGSASMQSEDLYWIWVEKIISGREWKTGEPEEQYKFTIKAADKTTQQAVDDENIQFISGNSKKETADSTLRTSVSVSTDDTKIKEGRHIDSLRIYFKDITFESDEGNVYTFDISEAKDTPLKGGITYDDTTYRVELLVTDNENSKGESKPDGIVEVAVDSVTKINGSQTTEYSCETHDDTKHNKAIILPFTNTYDSKGDWTFTISKTLTGRPWATDETFNFDLTLSDYTPDKNATDEYSKANYKEPQPMSLSVAAPSSGGNESTINGTVTFNEPGTYEFTLTEKTDTIEDQGITTTPSSGYKITVEVTDNMDGKLSAQVASYTMGGTETKVESTFDNIFNFTNAYAADGTLTLSVEKMIKGRAWQEFDTFDFTIEAYGDTIDKVGADGEKGKYVIMPDDQTATVKYDGTSDHKADFGAITFKSNGTVGTYYYQFKVSETVPEGAVDGVYYNGLTYSKPYIVTVSVTDNGKGSLSAVVTSVAPEDSEPISTPSNTITFTNTYAASGTLEKIDVTKVLKGRNWLTGGESFSFDIQLVDKDGNPVTSDYVTVPSALTITSSTATENEEVKDSFGATSFVYAQDEYGTNSKKTYYFKITEVQPTAADGYTVTKDSYSKNVFKGVTYDNKVYIVEVEVTHDYKGKLTAEIVSPTDGIVFTNEYNAAAVWQPTVSKTFTGRKSGWLETDSFAFDITVSDDTDNTITNAKQIVSVSKGTETSDTYRSNFGEITFTKPGTFTFTVNEAQPEAAGDYEVTKAGDGKNVFKGITYDNTEYTLTVTVTDNFDGTLSYTVTSDSEKFVANGENTQLKFTNVYNAYGEWTPQVKKQLTGRDWLKVGDIKGESPLAERESYEFSVKFAESSDASVTLPANLTVDKPDTPVSFESVKFTKPGSFTFTVQEEKPADITGNVFEGIAYSEKIYTVTAKVTDNNDGTLTIDTSAVDEAKEKAEEPYTFVNSYTATGTLTKSISISKTLLDRIWHKTESFTFDVTPAENAKAAVDGGMITLPKVGAEIFGDDDLGNKQTGYANDISFLKDEDHQLKDGTYSFIISETVPDDAKDVDGKKVYLGISYDLSQYKVEIQVTDLHNGNIKAEVTSITKVGGTGEPVEIAFVNDYDPSGVWPPVISKTIDGRDWLYDYKNINGEMITDRFNFTVELADEQRDGIDKNNVDFNNNNLSVDKKTVDKDNNPTYDGETNSVIAQFKDITFTKDGVYRFVVKETGTDENGMTLSKVVYTMDVTVKDDEEGLLTPVDFTVTDDSGNLVIYDEENPLSFVNTYQATTELSKITVSKTLNGRNWLKTGNTFGSGTASEDESFDFTLSLAEGHTADNADYIELPENISVIGTTEGTPYTKTFGNVTFHSNGKEVNDYAIEVSEVIPDGITPVDGKYVQNGLTYDSKKYTVDLKVKDDFLGNLTVEVDNKDVFNGLSFVNDYSAQGIISGITVNKTLEGRQWSDKDKFNFELSVSEKPDGSSVSFDNNGVKEAVGKLTITKGIDVSYTYIGVFGDITVDEPGDYEFTLKEVSNTSDGTLYDEKTCTITAKAVDNNDGTITITEVNGADDLSFTNKAYVDSQLTVIKDLHGRAWSDTDSFTATLTLTKDGSSTDDVKLKTQSGETDVPDSLTFTQTAPSTQLPLRFYQPGVYTFTIKETAGSAAGLTYDGSVHTWTVTVDDNDGQLEITDSTVDGKNGALSADTISIVNTYKYSDKITISKDFIGRAEDKWLYTDKFTFDVKADKDTEKYFDEGVLAFDGRYAKGVSSAEAVISAADSIKSVDIPLDITNLDFTSADKYNFTFLVSEQSTPDNGIAYSKAVYKVTFTVTENSDKTYNVTKVISVSENADDNYAPADDIVFKNIYTAKPVTAFINIYKQLTGASWDDLKDSFVFTADPSEDNPESGATVKNGSINAQSDKIPTADTLRKGNMSVEFTKAGEYEFTIKEKSGSNDGILYDNKHTYQLVVKVEDNDSGNLAITSLTIDGEEYISGADGVINSVSVTDEDVFFTNGYHAEAELSGITAVKLLKGRDWKNSDESFSFTIAPADDYTENEAGKTVIIPDPASANEDNNGKALFDALKFVSDGKETHIYKFTVSEIVPGGVINRTDKGLTYSDKTYDVYVKVTDRFNGHMTAEFVDKDGNSLADQQLSLDFTNEYVSSGKWSFSVTENFIGRPWISADVFNYDIAVETEVPDGLTVTVPDSMHISMPAPSNTAGIAAASAVKTQHSADYAADFDKTAQYSFTKPGEYTFTITQKKDFRSKQLSDYGISFDDTVYEVTVQVTDDNEGKLNAEITKLLIDGKPVDDIDAYGDSFAFTNTYSATTTWNMSVEKQIDGREWKNIKDYPDSPDDFEFTIEAYGDETIQAVKDGTITVANGKTNITAQTPIHTSSFGNITFNSNGTVGSIYYSFIIRETTPSDTKGLTYSKPYIVTFEVTDDGEGTLTAVVTDVLQEGTKQKGDYTVNGNSVTVTFTNTYAANGSLSENSISAAKVLTGREWLGIEGVFTDFFTFALKPDLEDAITADAFRSGLIKLNGDTVTVTDETAEHKDYFGSIDFKSNGQKTTVYTFKLSEIISKGYEKEYSIDYDDAVFTVKVEVTDNYDGTLSAKIISGAEAEFTNEYTASGVWPPVVNKVIDGREWLADDKFTFKIALDEENSDYPVVITQDTLTIGKDDLDTTTGLYTKQFEDIIFSKPGNYFFTVSEEKGQAGGLTYSDTEYYMYVRVVDEENKGTLVPYIYFAIPQNSVPAITGSEVGIEKALSFVNTYSATATLDKIEVSKKLTGRDWLKQGDTTGKTVLTEDESYKFAITAADEYTSAAVNRKDIVLPADVSISGASDGAIYKALFDGIIFNSNGNRTNNYTFEIREKIPADKEKLGGVEYDKSVYTVKVTVTDDFKGKLTLNAEIPDNILFTNVYTSTGTIEKGEIKVSKTLTGRPWQADDKFEFEIKNTVKPANSTVTIADEGKFIIEKGADIGDTFTDAFGDITFDEPGEYEFEIREINNGEPSGIDYDDTVYTVKVSVSDNYDGTLTAVVTGADNISFTNKYHAEAASAEINFTKKVTGRHWEKGEAFAFRLEAADTLTQQAIDSNLVILPDNAEMTLTGDGIKDEMTSAFGAIKFNSDGKSETTYKFNVTEEKGTRGGLTYDETVYTVTAVVKDDFKGKLTAELSGAENILFTNTYAAAGSLADNAISASKVLTGREWLDNDLVKDGFTFVIQPYGDTVNAVGKTVFMPKNTEIIVTDKNDPKVFFEKIDFKSDGERTAEYKFKVTEQNTQASGIDYDTSEYVITVTVYDDYNGALTAEVTDISKDGEPVESIVFTNDYSAYGIWPPVVDKVIDGRKWLDSDSFTFKITLTYEEVENSVNMPDDNTVDVTASDNKDGKYAAQFDNITFTKPGLYIFEVSEEIGKTPGLTYDTTVYEMYVDVSDDGMGRLTPKVVRVIDQQGNDFDYGHINNLTFTNKYNAVGTLEAGGITVSKLLDGREWLDSDSFKFTIAPAEDYGSNVEIVENSITISGTDSEKTSSFGNITFRKAGTYRFNISEASGDVPNITYDTSVYTVTVEATDNYDGTLAVNVTGSSAFTFTNTFVPDETSSEETAPPSEESTTPPEETTSDEVTTPPEETTSDEATTPPEETTSDEVTTPPEETTPPPVTTTDNNRVDGEDDENNKPDDNVNTGTPLDAGAFAAASVLLAALIPTLNRRKNKKNK